MRIRELATGRLGIARQTRAHDIYVVYFDGEWAVGANGRIDTDEADELLDGMEDVGAGLTVEYLTSSEFEEVPETT